MQQNKKKLSAVEYIPLDDIDPTNDMFQTRRFEAMRNSLKYQARQDSIQLVKNLTNELKLLSQVHNKDTRKAHLEPIVVFDDGEGKFIIVSGWHRYVAYLWYNSKIAKTGKQKKTIRVKKYLGNKDEAMIYSANRDIKPTLPKNNEQKLNAAWALIYTENQEAAKLSNRALGRQCGVSYETVRKMRSLFNKLKEADEEPIANWKFQQMKSNSNQLPEEDEMQAKINHNASKLINSLLHGTCRGDKEMCLEILKEVAKRTGIKDETLDLLLDPEPDF